MSDADEHSWKSSNQCDCDHSTAHNRSFFLITRFVHDSESTIVDELHDVLLRVQIDAKPSVPHSEGSRPRSKKIFVGGLGSETYDGEFLPDTNSTLPCCILVI